MNVFLISDTHFSHAKTWQEFKREDGSPLRPFSSTEEMDETLIDNWNKVVGPKDKIYHLGDVGFFNSTGFANVFRRLKGDKVLIKGNHDDFLKPSTLLEYFRDIRAYHVMDKHLLAHIPVHEESKARWKAQVHGHTHHRVMRDPWYINVCVETRGYSPVAWEDVRVK